MEKKWYSRTDISPEVQMIMAKASATVKQMNSMTLVDFKDKEALIRELFGSVGSAPFVGDNFHCDFGQNILVGNNFHADYNCTMLDLSNRPRRWYLYRRTPTGAGRSRS